MSGTELVTVAACGLVRQNCLTIRLRTQLKARLNAWGVGLWADKDTEDVAYACAECFYYAFPCGSLNFVPDDPIDLIAAFDPHGDLCSHAAVSQLSVQILFSMGSPPMPAGRRIWAGLHWMPVN